MIDKFKFISKEKTSTLPKTSGVYAFKKEREIIYIGKAANVKDRVKNHFSQPHLHQSFGGQAAFRDNLFFNRVKKVGYIKTDSEIEALLLEAALIKKYQPKYNVIWKDDKNYFYVAITKEEFPRIFITHQPKLVFRILYHISNIRNKKIQNTKYKIQNTEFVGPFVEGASLKKALKILRRIFPYYTAKKHPKGLCPWCYLDLCPGPNPDKNEYSQNIRNLVAVLKGKRKSILKKLKKEMKFLSNQQDFERAAKIRDQIDVLEKVISHASIFESQPLIINWSKIQKILKEILKIKKDISRIEAYDISNIQGKEATGSMVTFIDGSPDKNFYRKFKIRISGKPNDVAMVKEILTRRFRHSEWGWPDLILIDGGKAQLNAAKAAIEQFNNLTIPAMALAKRRNELFMKNKKEPILLKNLPRGIFNLILQMRDEAHRFAISYHRKLRKKF